MAGRVDHHINSVIISCCDPTNASDKGPCLEIAADANSALVASNTIVTNVDILSLRSERRAGLNPDGDVIGPADVALEREPANCRVTNAIDVASERRFTISSIASAGRVCGERRKTSGGIGAASGVALKRKTPNSRVAVAGRVVR